MTHPKWKTSDEFPGSISLPFGIKTSHTWHEIGQLLRIINDLDIYSFAELGCHVGGLASILNVRSRYHPFRYVGFDDKGEHIDDTVREHVLIHIGDIFENVPETWRLAKSGKTFLYCDNGDKIREMREFAPLLYPGDVIACHDYFDAQKVYGLEGFGFFDTCGCVPEVWYDSIRFMFDDEHFEQLPDYLLEGTRIMGFMKV
ncbi:MAG: hypothetical protein ACXADY_18280 [Candidatus Hodarchaeales archaeon]|jgi:hypothetical protein